MRKNLTNVIHYFAQFSYAPTFDEIHTFFPEKMTRKALHSLIKSECDAGKLIRIPKNKYFRASDPSFFDFNLEFEFPRYTIPQYSIARENKSKFQINIQIKKSLGMIQFFISILKKLPLVRFVGVTGKSAVEGYRDNDDVDLFIITRHGYIWTARFFVVLIAKALGIHGGKGVCLNLFFDERDLLIPIKKQNEYIAHELLQLKPIVDKDDMYKALLEVNRWIFAIFPNARRQKLEVRSKNSVSFYFLYSVFCLLIEPFMRLFQLAIIKKNKTGFLITPAQLWLFKQDFERKLKRKGLRKVI